MIYPDLEFTLSLLVKGHHTHEASDLLRGAPLPLRLSLAHRVQIENGLLRSLRHPDKNREVLAMDGLRLWRQDLLEEVFLIQSFNLEAGFALVASWNATWKAQPPLWSLLLHPALAVTTGATFLSFDATLRKCAADKGVKLLPAKL